jgi:hypothetical protein
LTALFSSQALRDAWAEQVGPSSGCFANATCLVRREDERADALRAIGAEVVVGDLTRAADIARALADGPYIWELG